MPAEIKDAQGLFTSGVTLAHVDSGVVTGAGGPFTSGRDIVKVENGSIKEVGGLLETGQTIAKLQGDKVVSTAGFLESGDTIAVIDGNKIRDTSGIVFTRGDVIAEVEGRATKEEKAAAAAALALGYIDQNPSFEDVVTQEAGQATAKVAESLTQSAVRTASQTDTSELGAKVIKYTAAGGVIVGVLVLLDTVLAVLDFFPGLSFDAEGIWTVFESGIVEGLIALSVLAMWVGGGIWYFARDYGSGTKETAGDSSVTTEQEGMQVDADFDKEELRDRIENKKVLSPVEAAVLLHEFHDFEHGVETRSVIADKLLDTARAYSPEEIYQQYQGSAVMPNDLMDEFYMLLAEADDPNAKEGASMALFEFVQSYPEWLMKGGQNKNADAFCDLVLNSVENPSVIENCLKTLAIGVAAHSDKMPVDEDWFNRFETHENEQIQRAAYSSKLIIGSGKINLPSPDSTVVDSDVDTTSILLKLGRKDVEFTPAEAAATLPILTHPDWVERSGAAAMLSATADEYSALAIFEEYTGNTVTPYAAMDTFYELIAEGEMVEMRADGASALHLFMISYPEWIHQKKNEQKIRKIVETELEHPLVIQNCLIALALGVASQPEQSAIDESWFTQFTESSNEEIREGADIATWIIDRGGPVDDPADKFG